MQLVLLALHLRKESIHAHEAGYPLVVAAQDCLPRRLRQLAPRHIHRNAQLCRMFLQIRKPRPVLRPLPRIDGPFAQTQSLVRNHEVQIEVHCIAESLAPRASPKRIVKAEQPRLRLLARPVAACALKRTRKSVTFALASFIAWNFFENDLATLAVSDLRRIHNSRPILSVDHNPIQQHKYRQRKVQIQQRLRRRNLNNFPLLIQPVESLRSQLRQPRFQRLRVG